MDDGGLRKIKGSGKSQLEQVSTHFGNLETRREPVIISLENLPDPAVYGKVVDEFYEQLSEESPYTYVDHIGEGGMGIVEMVKDKKCLRTIARKTLVARNMDHESVVRFTEEAQITAQLEHPNIVPVYDLSLDQEGNLFYTMKMVKGLNLKQILNQIKDKDEETIRKFPLANLIEIFLAVCDAMSYACSRKIVHRDLKPDNIMVGDYGEVYLVDWGLAKVINQNTQHSAEGIPNWIVKEVYEQKNLKNDNILKEIKKIDSLRTREMDLSISFNDVLIGTPQYMAPERISGEASECSEVYALGAILYNILTLQLTVKADKLEDMITKIFNSDIRNPLSFNNLPHLPNGKVPSALAAVTMKALSADADERYQKVSQLRNEIALWEDGYTTDAEKAGILLILWSQLKRHKLETLIGITFFIILIVIYAVYAINLNEDKKVAIQSEKVALAQKKIAEEETKKLIEKSKQVEDKINQLINLAPELYERTMFLMDNSNMEQALKTITNATKLSPRPEYFKLKGDIEQTLNLFKESVESYKIAYEKMPESLKLKRSLSTSISYLKKQPLTYIDRVVLHDFMVSQERHAEAIFTFSQLHEHNKNLKISILNKFKNSNLNFVKFKDLKDLPEGGFSLDLSGRNISDISILKGLPFKILRLSENPIRDITALEDMPLTELYIDDTKVRYIKALKSAPLKVFHAQNTNIESLEVFVKAPLQDVIVFNTKIKSLNGLKSPYIRRLNASYTKIQNLEDAVVKPLKSLDISYTEVSDLSPLSNGQLRSLTMDNTPVTDLSPLQGTVLFSLNMAASNVTDYSVIQKLPLTYFQANGGKFKNLSFLEGKHLNYLSIASTEVTDLGQLKGMPLNILNIENTQINNLDPITECPLENLNFKSCKQLKKLPNFINLSEKAGIDLWNSGIEDLTGLTGRNLEMLNLTQSSIQSLKGLENSSIRYLFLSDTRVSDLSPLRGKSYKKLHFSKTNVTDISPLSESLIEEIDLSDTKIKDHSHLKKINAKRIRAVKAGINTIDFVNAHTIYRLEISSNGKVDLSPLANSGIEILNLAHCKVQNFEVLATCKRLHDIDLYSTGISSLKPLEKLDLKRLIIGECKNIQNLDVLKNFKTLNRLIIPDHIKDISVLQEIPSVKFLGLYSSDHGMTQKQFWKKYGKRYSDEQQ